MTPEAAKHFRATTSSSEQVKRSPPAGWQAAPRLQQAIEAPEREQQRVQGAEQDVDRGCRHQAACRMHGFQAFGKRDRTSVLRAA